MRAAAKIREKRKYTRVNTVFPVEFRLRAGGDEPSVWHQGFSHDVGRGGICLLLNLIDLKLWKEIETGCFLELKIHLPLSSRSVRADAQVVWSKVGSLKDEARFFTGLEFSRVDPKDSASLVRFAYGKKLFLRLAAIIFVGLLFSLSYVLIQTRK